MHPVNMSNYPDNSANDQPCTIIIGDVHGCLLELNQLLLELAPTEHDHLIFIGDLIDRGPDSAGVVERVVELSVRHRVSLILGNHEEKFLRYRRHRAAGKGVERQMLGTEEFPMLMERLQSIHFEFLENAYYTLHLPEYRTLLVHGGIPGQVKFPLPATYRYGEHAPRDYPGLDLLTKTRFLDENGSFVALNEQKPQDQFWAETYDGRYGHVVFGHEPFMEAAPKEFPFATGVDTGCVYGGKLSALVLPAAL